MGGALGQRGDNTRLGSKKPLAGRGKLTKHLSLGLDSREGKILLQFYKKKVEKYIG